MAKGVTIGVDSIYNGKASFGVGFASAVVSGGISAELGGGKFANGAVTAAYGYVYNNAAALFTGALALWGAAVISTTPPSQGSPGANTTDLGTTTVPSAPARSHASDGFIGWVQGLFDGLFHSQASSAQDVLSPGGELVGEPGRSGNVRIVKPGQVDQIANDLKGLGVEPVSKPGYESHGGKWYDLKNGQGGFGVRESKGYGPTIDLDIPSMPGVKKIHQQ